MSSREKTEATAMGMFLALLVLVMVLPYWVLR